jgi:hypothetical protein
LASSPNGTGTKAAKTTIPTSTAERLVPADVALVDSEGAGSVEYTTALSSTSSSASGTITAYHSTPSAINSIEAVGADGDIIDNLHRGEGNVATSVQDTSALGGAAVLDGKILKCDLTTQHLEDAIQIVAIDDGTGSALPFDGQVAGDVQITGSAGIFVGPWYRQRERPTGDNDGIGAPAGIGRHDSRPQ